MRSDLANATALFETTKKAHTKLQRENASTVTELGETKHELTATQGELTEAKIEVEESTHLLDEFERAQERLHGGAVHVERS
jgi:septal ring factor EnvC (AmiA/AmiB activator)